MTDRMPDHMPDPKTDHGQVGTIDQRADPDEVEEREALSLCDALRLAETNTPEVRALVGEKLAKLLHSRDLAPGETQLALDVVQALAQDASIRVRSALSRHIAHYPLLPAAIAERLARDVDDVAVHVLEHCEGLSDEILLQVIEEAVERKQMAIARRREVSERVSDALIGTGNPHVVGTLLNNAGARITETALGRVLDNHGDHPEIPVLVAKRPSLPGETCLKCAALLVADQLEASAADEMRRYLVQQQNLPDEMAAEIVGQAREQAVAEMAAAEPDTAKVSDFVSVLAKAGRLSATLLLRSLCSGDLRFVELAFAKLARKPVDTVRRAFEPGNGGFFKSIYEETPLPRSLRPAFQAAVAAAAKARSEAGGRPLDPQRYVPTVISSIVATYGTVAPAELEHVLAELSHTLKREAAAPEADTRAHLRA